MPAPNKCDGKKSLGRSATAATTTSSSSSSSSSTSVSSLASSSKPNSHNNQYCDENNDKPSEESSWSSSSIPRYDYTYTTYYYCPSKDNNNSGGRRRRFEQSLDVYQPTTALCDGDCKDKDKGVVVLVVGSGWMGHQPYVYWGTSWWNASLPQQIASLGYTCVVVRHSGGFPRIQLLLTKIHSPYSSGSLLTLLLVVHLVVFATLKWCWPYHDHDDTFGDASRNSLILATFAALFFYIFWYWQGQGAATLDDMLQDVSTAMQFVDKHLPSWIQQGERNGRERAERNDNVNKVPIIFGGYSSGAHVAATLLSSKELSPLVKPNSLSNVSIQHVLYISGFLDVSPSSWVVTMLTLLVLGQWPTTVPSPLQALKDRPRQPKTHPTNNLPPHTLIGCQNEVFGLNILDSAFCSDTYADILNQQHPARAECHLLPEWTCNHWSVLSTTALRKTLHNSLQTIFSEISKHENPS